MLRRHDFGADYRVLFDHIDDLLIYNDSNSPTELSIFQIKGWEGKNCTPSVLLEFSAKDPVPRTIPGKLYWSILKFGRPAIASFGVVTNSVLRVGLKPKGKSTVDHFKVTGEQMADADWKGIEDAILSDHPGVTLPECRSVWLLERVPLDVRGHEGQLRQHLIEAMMSRGAVPDESPIHGVCTLLIEHVCSKIGFAAEYEDGDTDALFALKSMTRREFEAFLKRPSDEPTFRRVWPLIERALIQRAWKDVAILKVQNACFAYIRNRVVGQMDAMGFSRSAKEVFENSREELSRCESVLDAVDMLTGLQFGPLASDATDFSSLGAKIVEASEAVLWPTLTTADSSALSTL